MALALEIWWINPALTTGLKPFGLPVEEAVFFLVTNLMVISGLTLALQLEARSRLLRALRRRRPWWRLLLGLWLVSMIPTPIFPSLFPVFAYISTVLLALGVLGVAIEAYGPRALGLALTAVAFGVLIEWLGSTTGVPFGRYHYTAPGPALLGVPLLVPIGWWSFTMVAVAVAPAGLTRWLAPLALVAWDLGLDPLMVSQGFWRFDPPGFYLGVPLSNFIGWYLGGWVLVSILLKLEPRLNRSAPRSLRLVFVAQAFLVTAGLTFLGLPLAAVVTMLAMAPFMLFWARPNTGTAGLGGVE